MTIQQGLALILAFGVPFSTSACSVFTGSGDDSGNVRVVMSASDQSSLAPSLSTSGDDDDDDDDGEHRGDRFLERLETANVTIASLLARNTDGQLIDLDMDLPQTIDREVHEVPAAAALLAGIAQRARILIRHVLNDAEHVGQPGSGRTPRTATRCGWCPPRPSRRR